MRASARAARGKNTSGGDAAAQGEDQNNHDDGTDEWDKQNDTQAVCSLRYEAGNQGDICSADGSQRKHDTTQAASARAVPFGEPRDEDGVNAGKSDTSERDAKNNAGSGGGEKETNRSQGGKDQA